MRGHTNPHNTRGCLFYVKGQRATRSAARRLDRLELDAGSTDLPPHQDAAVRDKIERQIEFRGNRFNAIL
jgi:hypothetical protein